jgi:hypothetical protein
MASLMANDESWSWSKSSVNRGWLGAGVVAKPSNQSGDEIFGRLVDVAFPVLDRDPMNSEHFGHLGLPQFEVKPVLPDMFTEGYWVRGIAFNGLPIW